MTREGPEDETDPVAAGRRKALDLLARRAHFRSELEAKLQARGFSAGTTQEVCDWLIERRYLDDREAARSLIAGAFRRKRFGPRRMRAELARRRVPEDIVEETVSTAWGVSEASEAEVALEAAREWSARRRFDREKLARYLERKGYGTGAIFRAVDELARERESPGPEAG